MPFDPQVHVGVAGIIINPYNELLVLQRQGSAGAGTWGLVGGWIDYKEDPKDSIVREFLEETDLQVGDPKLVGTTSWTWSSEPDTVITLFYRFDWRWYYNSARNAEPEKASHLDWVRFDDLVNLQLFPPLRKFITEEGFRY